MSPSAAHLVVTLAPAQPPSAAWYLLALGWGEQLTRSTPRFHLRRQPRMKAWFTTIAGPVCIVAAWVAVSPAQTATCPPEVASAKAMLMARGGEALASSRSQETQGRRTQS